MNVLELRMATTAMDTNNNNTGKYSGLFCCACVMGLCVLRILFWLPGLLAVCWSSLHLVVYQSVMRKSMMSCIVLMYTCRLSRATFVWDLRGWWNHPCDALDGVKFNGSLYSSPHAKSQSMTDEAWSRPIPHSVYLEFTDDCVFSLL